MAIVLVVAGVGSAILFPSGAIAAGLLGAYAVFSTTRMVLAYLLSLVFAITYGTVAATNRRASEIMLPVLDILQSVPILGFFPLVFVFLSRALPDPLGAELAVIVLIFTSMAWNMAFGVYEAITNLPHDLQDASSVFGLSGWMRFRRLQLPATIPKLVYNSILSWTVGWFYLVASEIFTFLGNTTVRPGLGSFIATAGQQGNIPGILVGIGTLATVVVALDTFLWRPLSVWSERFRMDVAVGGEHGVRPTPVYIRMSWLPRFPGIRRALAARLAPLARRWDRVGSRLDAFSTRHRRTFRAVRRLDLAMFAVIMVILIATGILGIASFALGPMPAGAGLLPLEIFTSLGRLALAYGICVAWTLPAAAWLARSKWAERYLTPALEVVASVPATALFPLIILFAVVLVSSLELQSEVTALIISIFAMQWYLLFNILAGVKSIPADLEEAAKVFNVRGRTYWKRVLLPAVMPSFLTGSITAWGAGWNALIVAEYIPFGRATYQVSYGIGRIIDIATYGGSFSGVSVGPDGSPNLLYLAIILMVFVVLGMNKLLWRPLIKRASERFRIEIA